MGEFDIEQLALMPQAARALLHALQPREFAKQGRCEARVELPLVQAGQKLRATMIKVLEHNLEDSEPIVHNELAVIRPGSGHEDLIADLLGTASLYRRFAPQLRERDHGRYRPGDEAEAVRLAETIDKQLSEKSEDELRRANRSVAACWTIAANAHDDIASAGAFLFRKGGAEGRFVALASLRAPTGKSDEGDDEGGVEGGEDEKKPD